MAGLYLKKNKIKRQHSFPLDFIKFLKEFLSARLIKVWIL